MIICGICGKDIEKAHFNKKYCSDSCKKQARKESQSKYKKSEKGKISNEKWVKSDKRKENECGYRKEPRYKKLSVIRVRKYNQRHPEKYQANQLKEKLRKRWLTNEARKKNKVSSKKYFQTPKGKQARKNGKAIRRMREKTGKVTAREWEEKLKEFNHSCAYCGAKEKIEQDHIIPLSKGGTHEIKNIQPLCRSCNAKKSDKL